MAIIHSLETQGNWLFKRRGFIPVVLFLFAIPAVATVNYEALNPGTVKLINWLCVLLVVLGFCVRAYTIGTTPRGTSGRNTDKQVAEQLNTTGIYSIVRHPLYLGNYLMWIGIVLFTKNFGFVIIVSLLYWIYYERIMIAEERFLEKKFGEPFLSWSGIVPAFIPRLSGFRQTAIPLSFKSVLRREYSGVLATVIGFVWVRILINLFQKHEFFLQRIYVYALVAALLLTIVLRSVKRYTGLLTESERS